MNVTTLKMNEDFKFYWTEYRQFKDQFIYDIQDNYNLKFRYKIKYYLEELWQSNAQKMFKRFLNEL